MGEGDGREAGGDRPSSLLLLLLLVRHDLSAAIGQDLLWIFVDLLWIVRSEVMGFFTLRRTNQKMVVHAPSFFDGAPRIHLRLRALRSLGR